VTGASDVPERSPVPEPSEPEPSEPEPSEPEPSEPAGAAGPDGTAQRRSGLRDPAAAVRGLGSGTLAMEAIVLLLAIQPIRVLAGNLGGWGVSLVVSLAVVALLLCGMMRRPWAWHAGTALQAMLLLAGFLHWSLGALGLIFAAAWAYATHVRSTVLD
jgi:hypothetical protein